jgi:hypothetical protein
MFIQLHTRGRWMHEEDSIMKYFVAATLAMGLSAPIAAAAAQNATVDQQIAEATHILPQDLRAGATVVTYDSETGSRKVLRQGTNFLECQPKMADGFERCYHKDFAPRRDFEARLRAQKKSDEEIQKAVAAAVKDGTLPQPPKAMMSYRGFDKSDRIQNLWVMSVPDATPETLGVSTVSQRDAALAGHGLPWLMLPGTPGAHIMIPINPPVKSSAVTDDAPDEIAQATLPLPEDLRADATVYKYNQKTGERVWLRKGTNFAECMPRGEDGFTWCYNRATAARRDFAARLRAQGKPEKEIQDAVAAATQDGTLKPAPFGTMSYRLYGKKDRIQLLWVLSVPGATPESIGVSTQSQREDAIGGDGRPWLMLEGTPGAHIMIPINK